MHMLRASCAIVAQRQQFNKEATPSVVHEFIFAEVKIVKLPSCCGAKEKCKNRPLVTRHFADSARLCTFTRPVTLRGVPCKCVVPLASVSAVLLGTNTWYSKWSFHINGVDWHLQLALSFGQLFYNFHTSLYLTATINRPYVLHFRGTLLDLHRSKTDNPSGLQQSSPTDVQTSATRCLPLD